ncbi:hypothetical protein HYU17_02540 [Candidatus Woesearchaeota archaeon]|nr:hypothetical protein [Candidatus Woesearchaeota archaeon]
MIISRGIKPEFIDERGTIAKLLDDGRTVIRSVLLIASKKGAVRANHYHKKDSHYAYLLSGSMEYAEQPVGSNGELSGRKETAVLMAGDMVYSAPMAAHAMVFLEDSVFLALATESRSQQAYEEDTVRVNVI